MEYIEAIEFYLMCAILCCVSAAGFISVGYFCLIVFQEYTRDDIRW